MRQRGSVRPAVFVSGGIAVLIVLGWLYFGSSKPGTIPDIPESASDDAHTEIATLEKLWKEHPNHAPIALQLGNLHAEQGNPQKAVEYYRAFLQLDTSATGWEVRLDVAKALYAMGRTSDAKSEVQWILNRQPDHAGALYNLGAIEANTGHPEQARVYWSQLIAKHPQDSLAQFARESLKQLE